MKLSDFDFELPEQLIATRPAVPRSASKMLVATDNDISDRRSSDLPEFLNAGDRLVLNDTKVIPARLAGERNRISEHGATSARIEATLLSPTSDGNWRALLKPLRKVREGEIIRFSNALSATVQSKIDGGVTLIFNVSGAEFDKELALAGTMPLPPYIAAKRASDARDMTDYQTIWARHSGAVAAPTASLHFDDVLLSNLRKRGIDISFVTLHVGAGTFLPVKVDDVRDHKMHAEWGEVTPEAADQINETKKRGGRVIPVGTTALRLIESASKDHRVQPWTGTTDIFIRPGYEFQIADGLVTNFHLPKSTLMMLVSALMGQQRIRNIYQHAIANQYRFFSYGDGSLLLPE